MEDKVEFDIIPRTNEEYISISYGCIKFVDSYKFLSGSSDSLVITLIDNIHRTLKSLKKQIVLDGNMLKIVNEIETLSSEGRIIDDFLKDFPYAIGKLKEALNIYISENYLKNLKKNS